MTFQRVQGWSSGMSEEMAVSLQEGQNEEDKAKDQSSGANSSCVPDWHCKLAPGLRFLISKIRGLGQVALKVPTIVSRDLVFKSVIWAKWSVFHVLESLWGHPVSSRRSQVSHHSSPWLLWQWQGVGLKWTLGQIQYHSSYVQGKHKVLNNLWLLQDCWIKTAVHLLTIPMPYGSVTSGFHTQRHILNEALFPL